MSKSPQPPSHEEAETLAINALRFLADDPARLGRFLALTGLGPADLKATAGQPHLLAAVLDHLMRDESLLLVFAADNRIPPERIAEAHRHLANH